MNDLTTRGAVAGEGSASPGGSSPGRSSPPAQGAMGREGPGPVRLAVVGTGILGCRHARVFHELEGATLVGIVSRTPEKAASVVPGLEALLTQRRLKAGRAF